MHYYQFNIGDYASHTRGLSLLEDLAYRRLIDEYYLAERALNGCSTDVARLIGFVQHEAEVVYILKRFFVELDGSWHHVRIEKEIKEFKDKQKKNAMAGKASAEARKNKGLSTDVQHTLNERTTTVQPTINHKPITKNQEPKNKTSIAPPDGVTESVWQDWLQLRKAKKAAVTQTAVDGIEREARKAGVSLQVALETCCARGWTGFKADWVADKGGQMTPTQKAVENLHVLTRGATAPKPFWATTEVKNELLR